MQTVFHCCYSGSVKYNAEPVCWLALAEISRFRAFLILANTKNQITMGEKVKKRPKTLFLSP